MDDDIWDVLTDLFGEVGIWFAPLSVIVLVAVVEIIYHLATGGWLG